MRKQTIFAVSGIKNSGKTTLILRLIRYFRKEGFSVSVIKHDGHDFVPDVPGTDSYRMRAAGAEGVAVFSGSRMMIIKEQADITEKELIRAFPEADIIILEGFKYSDHPKVEVIQGGRSGSPVCSPQNLLSVVTDLSPEVIQQGEYRDIPVFGMAEEDADCLARHLTDVLGIGT